MEEVCSRGRYIEMKGEFRKCKGIGQRIQKRV